MAITLITGLPGHGKGLYSLDIVNKLEKSSGRPVYYHNVKDLNLKWHQLDKPQEWVNCPEGSIILLDEAWQSFPLRPNAQIPPDFVAQLATHRHKGYDIFIVTQQPTQLDTFVRKLIDKHFHVVRKFGAESANVHEFVGLNSDPQKSRKNSIKHSYKYNKQIYNWYKSAEVHTVQTNRPMRIYFLWFGVPLLLAASFYFVNQKLNPVTGDIATGMKEQFVLERGAIDPLPNENPQQQQQQRPVLNYVEAHTAELVDFPHTAPAFVEVTKPVVAPYPAACVIMRSAGCRCYTQQGTRLDTSKDVCMQIVERGFFIEWEQKAPVQSQTAEKQQVYPARDASSNFSQAVGITSRSSPANAPAS